MKNKDINLIDLVLLKPNENTLQTISKIARENGIILSLNREYRSRKRLFSLENKLLGEFSKIPINTTKLKFLAIILSNSTITKEKLIESLRTLDNLDFHELLSKIDSQNPLDPNLSEEENYTIEINLKKYKKDILSLGINRGIEFLYHKHISLSDENLSLYKKIISLYQNSYLSKHDEVEFLIKPFKLKEKELSNFILDN